MQQEVVLTFASDEEEDFKGTLRTFMVPVDQVGFERYFGVGIGRAEEEKRAEWVLWFVWRAYAREQHDPRSFDEWLEALSEWDVPDADDDVSVRELPPDPTPGPPSA